MSGGAIVPKVLATAWFDDDDEYDKHRKEMKKSIRASARMSGMD